MEKLSSDEKNAVVISVFGKSISDIQVLLDDRINLIEQVDSLKGEKIQAELKVQNLTNISVPNLEDQKAALEKKNQALDVELDAVKAELSLKSKELENVKALAESSEKLLKDVQSQIAAGKAG